jgi:hypothetical protein
MLVLSNPAALRMARDYGFATFDDVFDETYDDVTELRARFEHVYKQFVGLCRLDETEIHRLRTSSVACVLHRPAKWNTIPTRS